SPVKGAHPSKLPSNPSISYSNSPSPTATGQNTPYLPLLAENSDLSTPPAHPINRSVELTNVDIAVTTPRMAVGSFPPLTSVREIREFDGSAEKLADFLASVEAHLAAYNLPLETGGIVHGDTDEGWTYVNTADYTRNPEM